MTEVWLEPGLVASWGSGEDKTQSLVFHWLEQSTEKKGVLYFQLENTAKLSLESWLFFLWTVAGGSGTCVCTIYNVNVRLRHRTRKIPESFGFGLCVVVALGFEGYLAYTNSSYYTFTKTPSMAVHHHHKYMVLQLHALEWILWKGTAIGRTTFALGQYTKVNFLICSLFKIFSPLPLRQPCDTLHFLLNT